MKRFFDLFNLIGIGVLAWLCAVQWTTNGRLGRENIRLDHIRTEQAATIETQTSTIKGQQLDLDEFRGRLVSAETQLKQLDDQLNKLTAERNIIATERDGLKADLDKWIAAVKQRDDLIKQAVKQRDDAVGQFNDLAAKYNSLVKGK